MRKYNKPEPPTPPRPPPDAELYAKIREVLDAELRAMDKAAALRFVGWPDNIAELRVLYEAGKVAEAQRLILVHLQKELGVK